MEAQSRGCPFWSAQGFSLALPTALSPSLSLKIKTVQKVAQDHPTYQESNL